MYVLLCSVQLYIWVEGTLHPVILVSVYNTIVCVVTAALGRTVYMSCIHLHTLEFV